MASKAVMDQQKSTLAVVAATRTHQDPVATKIAQKLSPYLLPGETMPDVGLFVRLLGRQVEGSLGQAVARDEAHAAELGDDPPIRGERGIARDHVRVVLVDQRVVIEALFGTSTAEALGLVGTIPMDPVAVARMGETVARNLRTVQLPPPRVKGAQYDAAGVADELEQGVARLTVALERVAQEVRELEGTQRDKDRALQEHTQTFSRVAGLLTELFRFAGEDELAARVRPSPRRPGRTQVEVDQEDAGGGTP